MPFDANLIYRAWRLLQQVTGCRQGAKIHLDKILPIGAGLGGGSSNAATTLVVLNALWQTHFPCSNWLIWASSLGRMYRFLYMAKRCLQRVLAKN